jgi:hypothetical protein
MGLQSLWMDEFLMDENPYLNLIWMKNLILR